MAVPVTSNRNLRVTLDEHLPSVTQPFISMERGAVQMGITPLSEKTNVHYLPGIGWALKANQFDRGKVQELTSAQSGVLGISNWLAHSSAVEFDSFRQQSLTGVSYDAGVQSSGSPFIKKDVGSGNSWDANDVADVAAFPQPEPSEDTTDMDRFLVLDSNHEPTDALTLTFYVPGGALQSSGALLTFYFSGPAGSDDSVVGIGQYALKLIGSGLARLFEFDGAEWTLRHIFRWAQSDVVFGATHTLAIVTNCADTSGYPGSVISMFPLTVVEQSGDPGGSVVRAYASLAASQLRLQDAEKNGFIYRVPRKTIVPATIGPLRIDVRRDVRVQLQVSKATYPDSGVLFDDVITIPCYPDDSEPFYLDWWGQVPDGTTLTGSLYDAGTGLELSGEAVTVTDKNGGQKTYTPNVGQRHYRVKIEFETDSTNTKTPVLTHFTLSRAATFDTPGVAPVTSPQQDSNSLFRHTPTAFTIQGDNLDGGGRGADLVFEDIAGEVDILSDRGGIPIKIDTTYDSGGSNRSVLFRGYIASAEGGRVTGGDRYGGSNRRKYTVSCNGEWARLQEALVPQRYSWGNVETDSFSKITDIIRILLRTAYPSDMVNIPDRDIRLFSTSQDSYITEPGGRVLDVVQQFARDYLGSQVIFDDNAGTNGSWRLLEAKVAPYTSVARFYQTPPEGKLAAYDGTYGVTTVGDQERVNTFVQKGTWQRHLERAEGNFVCVVGGTDGGARLSQIAVNVDSYNFLNLGSMDAGYPDGSHADYIGRFVPIYIVDQTITTQGGVDWLTRRVYDFACHSRTRLSFEAPLILITDSDDAEQTNPRPLRTYDVVDVEEYDGSFVQYIVASVDIQIEKAHISMATYHLIRPSNMAEKAVLPTSKSVARGMMRSAQQATGFGLQSNTNSSNNRDVKVDNLMVMPELPADPIQDLDPTSGTFGDFYYMLDFDPLP